MVIRTIIVMIIIIINISFDFIITITNVKIINKINQYNHQIIKRKKVLGLIRQIDFGLQGKYYSVKIINKIGSMVMIRHLGYIINLKSYYFEGIIIEGIVAIIKIKIIIIIITTFNY
jgi:hypothetical protein